MAMDWDDFGDWVIWGVLAFVFGAALVMALMFLASLVCDAIRFLGRRNASNKPPPRSIDDLLQSIPDVAYSYKELPAAAEDAGGNEESCAICVAAYEAGEACSVLPGCTHMFHKPCVVNWLRKKNTCPLCRATVTIGGGDVPAAPRQQAGTVVNAAEDMV